MPYRLAPNIECVLVKDREGVIRYHYAKTAPGSPDGGPDIPWIEPAHAEMMLSEGLIERVDEPDTDVTEPEDNGDPDRVRACLDALEQLDVPHEAGAPQARTILREGSFRFANDTVRQAVKQRKQQRTTTETAALGHG